MRILFLVLILANLAFAAWHAWFSGPDFPTQPIRSAAPAIELIANAVPESPDDGTLDAAEGAAGTAPLETCISVGAFPNRIDVQDAVAALAASGFEADQRTAQGDVWLGYWVYLDGIETQAQAAAIVEQLAVEGISEAYVIADASSGNIVSLGVFSVRARAQQRYADVEELGLAPVIADRSQPGEVIWLDVTAINGRRFDRTELPAIDVDPELLYAGCIE